MPTEKVRDLRLDRLSKQATRATAQDFGELIAESAWLNQFDDVRIRHGISLLRWRSGGFNYPHDMPPSRSTPSPTFDHSSNPRPYDKDIYKARHLIENFYCWLKQFRAIATRYDKTARNFLAAIHLAAAIA